MVIQGRGYQRGKIERGEEKFFLFIYRFLELFGFGLEAISQALLPLRRVLQVPRTLIDQANENKGYSK